MLLDQSPIDLGRTKDVYNMTENDYVDKSIRYALVLINEDLRMNAHKFSVECRTIEALPLILDYKRTYYQDSDEPENVRFDKLMAFERIKGFYFLAIYFEVRCNVPSFPRWELVHRALNASYEGIVYLRLSENGDVLGDYLSKRRKESHALAMAVRKHMIGMKCDSVAKVEVKKLSTIVSDLKLLHFEFALVDDQAMEQYFVFVKEMILKLLRCHSIPHKQYAQDLLHFLIRAIHGLAPIPTAYKVAGSGREMIDGNYFISSSKRDAGGYLVPGADPMYEHTDTDTGKKFVLMLSLIDGDYVWSFSEEHDTGPIPTEYTDYYTNQQQSKQHGIPPLTEWEAFDESDDPPPKLEPQVKMVQVRERHKTLKHDLATWFLENDVPNLILNTKRSDATEPSESSVSQLVEAIDNYIENNNTNFMTTNMSTLLVAMLPPLCNTSTNSLSPTSPNSQAAYETLKLRVASAERWHKNTARMLLNAQTEHDTSGKELEEAKSALKTFEMLSILGDASVNDAEEISNTSSITQDISSEEVMTLPKPPTRPRPKLTKAASNFGSLGTSRRASLAGAVSKGQKKPKKRRSLLDGSGYSK